MISGTSSRRWVVFKGALKRFKWFGILYGVVLFLELPLLIWMQLSREKALAGNLWPEAARQNFLPQIMFNPVEHLLNIVAAIVFGLLLFNYLQKDRASSFFHSLPIKRISLYFQNLLAGLTLLWLPLLINGLLIYGAFSLFGITQGQIHNPYGSSYGMEMTNNLPEVITLWQMVGYWLFLNLLMTAFFFVFTVFVGIFTGNVLLQGGLTVIGLILPLGLYLLIKYNLWRLLYGFSRDFDRSVEWLSPIFSYLSEQNYRLLTVASTWYLWYFVIALIICGLSIYLYKLRHVEAAGETLAAEWIRQVFKYGVVSCAALTGGLYLSSLNENSIGVLYLGYFIGAVLGYIIADMIAYKSFQFYRRWKGMMAFGTAFILILTAINLDLAGYERHVPPREKVKEVSLSIFNRDGLPVPQGLSEKENIRKVIELHREIINLKQENLDLQNRNNYRNIEAAKPVGSVAANVIKFPQPVYINLSINYLLEGGRRVTRTYQIDLVRYREFLAPIFDTEETKKIMYRRLFNIAEDKYDQININNYRFGKSVRIYKPEELREALAALRADVLAISYETAMEGKVPSRGVVEFLLKSQHEEKYVSTHLEYYEGSQNFEEFLKKYGYLEDLTFNTGEVSLLIVNQVGSDKTVEITDSQKIKDILSWSSIMSERDYLMRQQQPGNPRYIEYQGKLIIEKSNPLYVTFDMNPYAYQMLDKTINN